MRSTPRLTALGVPALLALALLLRVLMLVHEPGAPLYWDEQLYDSDAKKFAVAWRALGHADTTSVAFLQATSGRGEAYSAAVGLAYAVVGVWPHAVFGVQVVLDTLTCWFIYLLAYRLGGATAGLLALAGAAVYEPFIFAAVRLQSETLASFLYTGALVCLSDGGRRRTVRDAIAGILLGVAGLVKSALQFLPFALVPAIAVRERDCSWKRRSVYALVFLSGFLGIASARLIAWNVFAGGTPESVAAGAGTAAFAGLSLTDVGWLTGQCCTADKVRAALAGWPSHDPLEGRDYWMATVRNAMLHPAELAGVILHKLYRSWRHPYNDSRRTLLTPFAGQRLIHQAVLVLALVGLAAALRRWRSAAVLLVTVAYLWMVHLPVPIETRYTVTVMPLMVCLAGLGAALLGSGVYMEWRAGRHLRLLLSVAVCGCALVAVRWASVPRLVDVFPAMAPEAAHAVHATLQVALIALVTLAVVEILSTQWGRRAAVAGMVPTGVLAACVLLFGGAYAESWRAWKAPLHTRSVIEQTFLLPDRGQPPAAAHLRIDLLPACRDGDDLVVRVNGQEVHRYRGGVKRQDANSLPPVLLGSMLAARGEDRDAPHAWYTLPVPLGVITGTQPVRVELEVEGGPRDRSCVTVAGDYAGAPPLYDGPSLHAPEQPGDISLNKYLVTGDFRLRRQEPLDGSVRARFRDNGQWSEADLSSAPGRQTGRYRIFLLLTYPDKVVVE